MTDQTNVRIMGKHEAYNPRVRRSSDVEAMETAAAKMREAHGPGHPEHQVWEAFAALMDKTAWLGRANPDALSRVPCNEVIAAAKAYLDACDG